MLIKVKVKGSTGRVQQVRAILVPGLVIVTLMYRRCSVISSQPLISVSVETYNKKWQYHLTTVSQLVVWISKCICFNGNELHSICKICLYDTWHRLLDTIHSVPGRSAMSSLSLCFNFNKLLSAAFKKREVCHAVLAFGCSGQTPPS